MTFNWTYVEARFWRMLSIRWQRDPLKSGAHLVGGRFNRPGREALYLAGDHSTAIAEYHRMGVRPGTLAAYDIVSAHIADLTDPQTLASVGFDSGTIGAPWRTLYMEGETPPTWPLAERLIAAGADGALVPSFQRRSGTNLVLWRWHAADAAGEGAAVGVIDPEGDLRRR